MHRQAPNKAGPVKYGTTAKDKLKLWTERDWPAASHSRGERGGRERGQFPPFLNTQWLTYAIRANTAHLTAITQNTRGNFWTCYSWQTHTLTHTCSSTATSCRAGPSRGPRIQLKIWPMLVQSIQVCICFCLYVCACVSIRHCLGKLAACFWNSGGVDWNREKRGGPEGEVGVAMEQMGRGGRIRSESLQRLEHNSHNSLGY